METKKMNEIKKQEKEKRKGKTTGLSIQLCESSISLRPEWPDGALVKKQDRSTAVRTVPEKLREMRIQFASSISFK